MSETKRAGKYWICSLCALKKGWTYFKTGNTMILGLCGWCDHDKEEGLTPLSDLKNKEGKRADYEGA